MWPIAVVIAEHKFVAMLQRLVEHTAKLVQAIAFVVTVSQAIFARLLASIEAGPTTLIAMPLVASKSGLIAPEVIVGLVIRCADEQLVAIIVATTQVTVSLSSASFFSHLAPSCASFSRSQLCISSHKSQDCDRQTLVAGLARMCNSDLHPFGHVPEQF